MASKQALDLELVCREMPSQVPPSLRELRLGVQAKQEVRQEVICPVDQAVFSFPVQVSFDAQSGAPNFSGEYVHGPRGGRFIYLCWGERLNGQWQGVRRAKLPLQTVKRGLVEAALATGRPLRALIRATDAKGLPAAASLKPDAYEWTL